jgi:NitT/TauT family transport system substrate-binding protein
MPTRDAKKIRMTSARRAGRLAWATLALAALLATGAKAEQASVRFTLDRAIEGPAAPFLLPLDRGYYKAEGLTVAIDPAANPLDAITRVASGSHEMGFADINALIKYRDANPKAPVKAVFMVYNRPAYAVIARKSRRIAVPKDLEGKKLGAPVGDLAYAQWPIFAKVNGIDPAKVTVENIAPPLREPMLAAGQVDAITGMAFSSFINLDDKGVPVDDIVVMLMADYGVDLYGNAIIVNTRFAQEHPEAVRGFLRAFLKGLKQTVASPNAAIAVAVKQNDALKKGLEAKRLEMVIRDDILTPEVKANGYGGIDPARFARAIDQLALAYKFASAKPKLDEIFDDAFLPPAADRKLRQK